MRFFSFAACGLAMLFITCFLVPSAAQAQPAAEVAKAKGVYDTLFAAKLKAVRSTADRADDVALAKEMVAMVSSSDVEPLLLELVCEGAYELGLSHADGFVTAAQAMEVLGESVPDKRASAHERLVLVLHRQMTVGKVDERVGAAQTLVDLLTTLGDEKIASKDYTEAASDYRRAYALIQQRKMPFAEAMKAKLDFALARERTARQILRLQEKLSADLKDHVTARQLVDLYMIELDEPAEALPYVERVNDAKLTEVVTLAAKPLDSLTAEQCLVVGEWYLATSREHDTFAATLLPQARRHIARFLEIYSATDIERTKAEVLLKDTDAKLAEKKIVVAAAAGGDQPVKWGMRVWGGSRYVPRDLGNLDVKQDGEVAAFTNPPRINRGYVYLTNEQSAIPGGADFELTARVSGIGGVGLLRKEGQHKGQWAVRIDSAPRVLVTIRRKDGKMSFTVDGKPTTPDIRGPMAGEKDAYVFAVGLSPNQTIQIHDFKIMINK